MKYKQGRCANFSPHYIGPSKVEPGKIKPNNFCYTIQNVMKNWFCVTCCVYTLYFVYTVNLSGTRVSGVTVKIIVLLIRSQALPSGIRVFWSTRVRTNDG